MMARAADENSWKSNVSGIARMAACAIVALIVALLVDRFLNGGSAALFSTLKIIPKFARFVLDELDPVFSWIGARSWRPFLIVTGTVALFSLLVTKHTAHSKSRNVVDLIGMISGALFVGASVFYGVFLLFGSWQSARWMLAVFAIFLIASRSHRG